MRSEGGPAHGPDERLARATASSYCAAMRQDVTFFKPWMCARCGYLMDCTSAAVGPPRPPNEGDFAVCMNCGMPYFLKGDAWRPMSAAELSCLSMEERRELAMAQLAQSRARPELPADLAKRGGRA